jgi:ubiquinone/menaquinone biosynthesis C-methylase UbiE
VTTEPVRTWSSDEAAQVWRQGAARRAQTLAVATKHMLDAAGLQPGQHVLDVAAGTGDQSILATQRVGPSGSVLATDISPNMLAAAADTAREANLDNVTTQVADASALEVPVESFDAALCRFGLMFVPDLHQALSRVRGALKPGAHFAALVWSSEAKNPYIGLRVALLREMDRMPTPTPSLVRTVSLSGPGQLQQAFEAAGFTDVRVSPVATPREFASAEQALQAMSSDSPAQGELGKAMNDAEREHYTAELARRVQAYVQADGRCILPGEALLAVGTR